MTKARLSADLIATLEGFMWLSLAWSVSFSAWHGSVMPTLATLSLVGTLILVSWAHRPLRLALQRFRVRRRRTEMQMHLFALPVLLALLVAVVIETLLSTSLTGPQKMLLVNVMASAGWSVFVLTQVIKQLLFAFSGPTSRKTRQ